MEVQRIGIEEWQDGLPAGGFEPFHAPEALEVLDRHTPGERRLYGGYKGDHLVAMMPLFVREFAVGRAIFSPPPSMGVPRLGPLVMPNSPKQRSRETVNNRFIEGVLDEIGADSSRALVHMHCGIDYDDPRPFVWEGFSVEPTFTYRLPVQDPVEMLDAFSSDLRRDIRDGADLDVTIAQEGLDGARFVYELVERRFDEQDIESPLSWPFVKDIVESLDDRCRVYVARDGDGVALNGLIVLYSDDAAYSWQGGVANSYEGVSTNSLLQWTVVEDIAEDPSIDSVDTYDLTGANTKSLCTYKSGYGGQLTPYYTVESEGKKMDIAKRAYQMVAQ